MLKSNFTENIFSHFLPTNLHLEVVKTLQVKANQEGVLIATVGFLQVGFSAHHQLDCVGSLEYFIQCTHNIVPTNELNDSLSACFPNSRIIDTIRIFVNVLDFLASFNISSGKSPKTVCNSQDNELVVRDQLDAESAGQSISSSSYA